MEGLGQQKGAALLRSGWRWRRRLPQSRTDGRPTAELKLQARTRYVGPALDGGQRDPSELLKPGERLHPISELPHFARRVSLTQDWLRLVGGQLLQGDPEFTRQLGQVGFAFHAECTAKSIAVIGVTTNGPMETKEAHARRPFLQLRRVVRPEEPIVPFGFIWDLHGVQGSMR